MTKKPDHSDPEFTKEDGPEPIVMIEIVRSDGLYLAAPANSKKDGPFWGVTGSRVSVPDLLRNTADALETIRDASPDPDKQLPGFWIKSE